MRIHYLQHVPFEGLGRIEDWTHQARHTVSVSRLFKRDSLPAIDDVDFLIVMGGPMGATDDARFPWMRGEKVFIEQMIRREKKVLGICLGAQLMADVLGARVYRNRDKEIGWFPIELNASQARHTALNTLNQRSVVFHWHGDTFDLPSGAAHLARSQACENQAFAYGKHAIGLQFHLETGIPQMESLITHCAQDLTDLPYVQDPREMADLAPRFAPPLYGLLNRFLDAFTADHKVPNPA